MQLVLVPGDSTTASPLWDEGGLSSRPESLAPQSRTNRSPLRTAVILPCCPRHPPQAKSFDNLAFCVSCTTKVPLPEDYY